MWTSMCTGHEYKPLAMFGVQLLAENPPGWIAGEKLVVTKDLLDIQIHQKSGGIQIPVPTAPWYEKEEGEVEVET